MSGYLQRDQQGNFQRIDLIGSARFNQPGRILLHPCCRCLNLRPLLMTLGNKRIDRFAV